MNYITTSNVTKIISQYCKENKMSVSKYAQLAGVSKAWLSRLFHENKKISLQIAQQLLAVAGYSLQLIQKHGKVQTIISKKRLRRLAEYEIR